MQAVPDIGEHLQTLMGYTAWTNDFVCQELSAVAENILSEPRRGRHGGALGVPGLIYVVGLIWNGHLTGQAHGLNVSSLDTQPVFDGRLCSTRDQRCFDARKRASPDIAFVQSATATCFTLR